MCMFSGYVRSVSETCIFARAGIEGRQYIAYSMRLDAPEDVAMILPLPVKSGSGERALRFIDLHQYPEFFDDIREAFLPPIASRGKGMGAAAVGGRLAVHQVGSFEASYVPKIQDFVRLDPRFRLPADTWDKLPEYKTYGFAVFKLKRGANTIHPMAFEFPRADVSKLFFPTVHVHDGKVHESAQFEHLLYTQKTADDNFSLKDWKESERFADAFVKVAKAESLVIPKAHLYLRRIYGRQKNQDTWVV